MPVYRSSCRARAHVTSLIDLGVLAEYVPASLVGEVVAQCGRQEKRVRALPAVVMVYFMLALGLFSGQGYREVLRKITAHLGPVIESGGYRIAGSSALARARRRLGTEPLRCLFGRLCGPLAGPDVPGAYAFGRRLVLASMDGTVLDVPETTANVAAFGPPPRAGGAYGGGVAGYPQVRLLTLIACGTRAIIAAAFGPRKLSEHELARRLCACGQIGPGMLVLADRNFRGYPLISQFRGLGADLIWRASARLILPVLAEFADGSYQSVIPEPREGRRCAMARHRGKPITRLPRGIPVRVVEAQITLAPAHGRPRTESYRLLTTLDAATAPAQAIARTYAERWESETGYRELKAFLRNGQHVLRSKTPQGIEQEIYALLTTHQVIQSVRADAARHAGGHPADPDRISYTITLRALTRRITQRPTATPTTQATPRLSAIHEILTSQLPARRHRSYPRGLKNRNARRQAIQATPPGTMTYTITIRKPQGQPHPTSDP